ncbi:MAG: acetate--CoA ligase family protein, partial [Rhodobacteraceae bacterium]|nr:acetate--CoA ligase family protein [Paracoccaceae bacterium]
SAGNQAVLGLEDLIEVLCEKTEVRAIGVHIEGLQDIPRFERAALKALEQGTPIVALKTGSSTIGAKLTVSHTGSLSGANDLYEALFERTGVISVTNPAQFLETLKYLCVVGAPRGTRVAGFTCSGGGATMLADHAEIIGLTFPVFENDTAKALKGLLPDIATVSNPLDYTTPIWGQPEFTAPVFETALKRPDIDAAILLQDYPAAGLDDSKNYYQNDATAFAQSAAANNIPAMVCATLSENLDVLTREHLIGIGVAPMQGIHEALNALLAASLWRQARGRILKARPAPLDPVAMPQSSITLDEAEGKAWLAQSGLGIPKGRCSNGHQAPDVARDIGFPVALKMMGPKLAHKTEAGAVALGLNSADDVANAVAAMRASVTAYGADAVTDHFLIEQMSGTPLAEFIVGIRRDPQFGFAMTLGSGGILVELVGDAKTVLLPASLDDIQQALTGLRATKLLQGFRGRTVADLDGLAKSILEFSEYATSQSGTVYEVEINPLFVYENSVQAVDVLLQVVGPT